MNDKYRKWAEAELIKVKEKIEWVSEKNKYKLPYTTDENGIYDNRADSKKDFRIDDGINWWTNGFWAGILWLIYNDTKNEKYLEYARIQENLIKPAFEMYYGLHHDVGFMFVPSSVADYKITSDAEARKNALHAASLLAGRFNEKGKFIRAWNDLDDCDTKGWAIVDCMFNLSLLFWATRETGDPRFGHIAKAHATTVMNSFVRDNGSVCHIVEFDPESGKRIKSYGGQGYAHGSAWTRGQGWGLYGFVNAYRNSGDRAYLRTAEKIADYCITRIDDSGIIPIDFDQPKEPAFEDSCGACIIAGGLIDLSEQIEDEEKKTKYLDIAFKIIKTIAEKRADYSKSCEAIVQNCSASYFNKKHHETMVYADYFYIETLYKLTGSAYFMW
ncbi:MAG: glycoside hydrolase family 88 protein [Butyrivibrio sp.]|nr:glycoside hydrolase family 88 protein [Butyrivibrio sp.]